MLHGSDSILSMAFGSGPVVGGVLLLLLLASVGCWAVILLKLIVLRKATAQSREFLAIFWESRGFQAVLSQVDHLKRSPMAQIFRAGYAEWRRTRRATESDVSNSDDVVICVGGIEAVERTLRRAMEAETAHLQSMLIFLATVASAAPFIGLFGTVWGIMESFRDIGATGTANLAVVAPGISEALIATATGLAAAIPAVIAYNYFNNAIGVLSGEMEGFVTEFLNIVSRNREGSGAE